jgi:hypothetical protein
MANCNKSRNGSGKHGHGSSERKSFVWAGNIQEDDLMGIPGGIVCRVGSILSYSLSSSHKWVHQDVILWESSSGLVLNIDYRGFDASAKARARIVYKSL